MAATQLTVNTVSVTGYNITDGLEAANADGEYVQNPGGETMVIIENNSGGPLTVTVDATATLAAGTVTATDPTIVIADGKTYIIGGLFKNTFNTSSGVVNLTFSTVTSVKVCAVRTLV